MADKNTDIQIKIEAENLASEKFKEVSEDSQKLAKELDGADKELAKLRISKANLETFDQLQVQIKALDKELAIAQHTFKGMTEATEEDSIAKQKQKRVVEDLKKQSADLTRARKVELDQFNKNNAEQLRYNNTAKTTAKLQESIVKKIDETTVSQKKLSDSYEKSKRAVEAVVEQNTKNIAAAEKQEQLVKEQIETEKIFQEELERTNQAKQEQIEINKKIQQQEDQMFAEADRVAKATEEYRQDLERLNRAKSEGRIDSRDYVDAEKALRKELRLSTDDVEKYKNAIESRARKERQIGEELDAEYKKKVANQKAYMASLEKEARKLNEQFDANKKLTASIEKYSIELKKLQEQKEKGSISNADLTAGERRLRQELKLTTSQVESQRASILKLDDANEKARKSTDLLTSATRRIAQAYVVALAIEKVATAVSSTAQSYGELEGAMTTVEKTTGLMREQVVGLKDDLNEMALNVTPTATNELLKYAEVAGQLGINNRENLLDMAVASDALAVSTNLAGEEASLLLTRILLMTGEGVGAIHNISSSVVELGNNFAVAEDEIVHMAREMTTATASMGLGSSSAVALGATLKEAGQQAERSRTAMQRLAQVIQQGSKNGGEDLVKLMNVTGMTADEIEKNLGERPEQVILKFVEGLNRIKDEGGLVAETLENMGIKSLESQAVLEVLGDRSERLAEAINLSSDAYIAQDKHLIEASKVYADQASAVDRLINRFETLKSTLGESITDEVSVGLDDVGKGIGEVEELLTEFMQLTGDAIESVTEGIKTISPAVMEVGEAFYHLAKGLQVSFNMLQVTVDGLYLGLQKSAYEVKKFFGATDEELKGLDDSMMDTTKRIQGNMQDFADASAIINGQASDSYHDLRDAVNQNAEAVKNLSEEEREQIKLALETQGYMDGKNSEYNRLTASITRSANEIKILNATQELASKNRVKAEKAQAEQTERLDKLTNDLYKTETTLAKHRENLSQQLKDNLISQSDYNQAIDDAKALEKQLADEVEKKKKITESLNLAEKEKLQSSLELLEITKNQSQAEEALTASVNKHLSEINELQVTMVGLNKDSEKYISLQKQIDELSGDLAISTTQLNTQKKLEVLTQGELIESQRVHYDLLAKLAEQYRNDELSAKQYQQAVSDLAFETQFYAENILVQTDAEERLTEAKTGIVKATKEQIEAEKELAKEQRRAKKEADEDAKKSVKVKELEKQSITALTIAQEQHLDKLDLLKRQYQSGNITFIEYSTKVKEAEEVTRFLADALRDAKKEVKEVGDNAQVATQQIEGMSIVQKRLAERSAETNSTLAQGFFAAGSQMDFASASAKDLSNEIETLEGRIYQNKQVTSEWWTDLARAQIALDESSLATARSALKVDRLTESWKGIKNPTLDATLAMQRSIDAMGGLDSAKLDGLRSEVDATIQRFNQMEESISGNIRSVEDRLSSLRGAEMEILDRRHETEIAQAEAQKAQVKGNTELEKQAEKHIRLLKEAQRLEKEKAIEAERQAKIREQEQLQREAEMEATKETAPTPTTRVTAVQPQAQPLIAEQGARTVNITLTSGDKSANIVGIEQAVMDVLENAGFTVA